MNAKLINVIPLAVWKKYSEIAWMIIFIEDIKAPNLIVTRNFAWILKVSKVTMYVNNFKKERMKKVRSTSLEQWKNNKVITKIMQFKPS